MEEGGGGGGGWWGDLTPGAGKVKVRRHNGQHNLGPATSTSTSTSTSMQHH